MFRVGPYLALNKDQQWFEGKGKLGEYILNAKARPEIEHRLKWLSEGTLEYHMTQFESKCYGPAGNPEEKQLYSDFLTFLLGQER